MYESECEGERERYGIWQERKQETTEGPGLLFYNNTLPLEPAHFARPATVPAPEQSLPSELPLGPPLKGPTTFQYC